VNNIEFVFEEVKKFVFKSNILRENIFFLIKNEGRTAGNIVVIFCHDKYLLDLNNQFLQHDFFTDILTFDYSEHMELSGDLFISIDRVRENAANYNKFFLEELYRVVIHGVLHLAGYSDQSDEEKLIMRKKENFYLDRINFKEKNE